MMETEEILRKAVQGSSCYEIFRIFKFLDYQSLLKACLVCQKWKHICSIPKLHDTLVLAGSTRCSLLMIQTLKECKKGLISNISQNIRHLCLVSQSESVCRRLLKCPDLSNLEKLECWKCFPVAETKTMLRECTQLKSLSLNFTDSDLALSENYFNDDPQGDYILPELRHLQSLTLGEIPHGKVLKLSANGPFKSELLHLDLTFSNGSIDSIAIYILKLGLAPSFLSLLCSKPKNPVRFTLLQRDLLPLRSGSFDNLLELVRGSRKLSEVYFRTPHVSIRREVSQLAVSLLNKVSPYNSIKSLDIPLIFEDLTRVIQKVHMLRHIGADEVSLGVGHGMPEAFDFIDKIRGVKTLNIRENWRAGMRQIKFLKHCAGLESAHVGLAKVCFKQSGHDSKTDTRNSVL